MKQQASWTSGQQEPPCIASRSKGLFCSNQWGNYWSVGINISHVALYFLLSISSLECHTDAWTTWLLGIQGRNGWRKLGDGIYCHIYSPCLPFPPFYKNICFWEKEQPFPSPGNTVCDCCFQPSKWTSAPCKHACSIFTSLHWVNFCAFTFREWPCSSWAQPNSFLHLHISLCFFKPTFSEENK